MINPFLLRLDVDYLWKLVKRYVDNEELIEEIDRKKDRLVEILEQGHTLTIHQKQELIKLGMFLGALNGFRFTAEYVRDATKNKVQPSTVSKTVPRIN